MPKYIARLSLSCDRLDARALRIVRKIWCPIIHGGRVLIIYSISSALAIIFPQYHFYLYYPLGFSIIIALLGIGLFESTAIQFGMDQMLEASSDKLSTFIHWYYWSSNLGRLVALYISYVIIIYYHQSIVNLTQMLTTS